MQTKEDIIKYKGREVRVCVPREGEPSFSLDGFENDYLTMDDMLGMETILTMARALAEDLQYDFYVEEKERYKEGE